MLSTSSTRMYAFQILSTIRQLGTIRAGSSQSASRIVASSRFGGREVGWIAEDVAPEAELVPVVGDRSLQVGDEQHRRDAGHRRHARMQRRTTPAASEPRLGQAPGGGVRFPLRLADAREPLVDR